MTPKSSHAKKPKRGRPPVEIKKKPFQVMLDPRYIDHFRKVAGQKNIQPQDLARMALNAMIPDPFNPLSGSSKMGEAGRGKKAMGPRSPNK
jgi:hypothetical protein